MRKLAIEILYRADKGYDFVTVIVPENLNRLEVAGIMQSVLDELHLDRSHIKLIQRSPDRGDE
jgi:hypothetical protein